MKKAMTVFLAWLVFASVAAGRAKGGDILEGIQPGADGKIDVVTIFPHQDDETIFAGGTLLTVKQDPRARTHVICLTLGELSSAKEVLKITPEEQGRIRTQELLSAAAALSVDEVIQLHYHDQGLASLDQAALTKEIVELIARTGAEVVITYGADGITGHIDHRTLSQAVTAAFPQSQAQKLYYVSLPRRLSLLYSLYSHSRPRPPTLAVDIRPVKKLKNLALHEHATQRDFSGRFSTLEMTGKIKHEWFTLAGEKP
jgi:LmbE family N-acetylglucosaminyl deacetylase